VNGPPRSSEAALVGAAPYRGSAVSGCGPKGSTPTLATFRELLAARPGDPLAAHLAELVAALEELAALQRGRPAA